MIRWSSAPILLPLVLMGCQPGDAPEGEDAPEAEPMQAASSDTLATPDPYVWTAELAPVNDQLTEGSPSGQARLSIVGDSLVIAVSASGVPADMMHLQHFHGFESGASATCPGPDADANGDGVIDVTETADAAGTTMVPFHADPASMEIQAETYPMAEADGSYAYRQSVHLDSMRSAFQERFGSDDLALGDRVVFVHGVPADTGLPASAASVLGVPAHITVPIACGALEPFE